MAKDDYADRSADSPIRDDKDGAGKIKKLYKEGLQSIRTEQYDFWCNSAFLHGDQWIYYDKGRNTLDQLPRDPDRVQMTVNKLWPSARTLIAKSVSRPLVFNVVPTAADDATIRAAHLAESILTAVKDDHDWEGIREDSMWNTLKGAAAAICVDWDPEAGTPLGLDPDGKSFGTGDTREEALSIVDFVVEPGVRNAETARWWIKSLALPPEQVQEMYGLPVKPKPDASAALTPSQAKMAGNAAAAQTNLTQVLTYYERPNRLRPAGKVCVVVAEKIVSESDWKFPFRDRLNFAITRETRIGGRWTGETVMKAARPVQTALNQSWSSVVEHMKLAGNARLPIPQSAVDLMDQLTDLPGEIIPVPDNLTLQGYLSPPQMPGWWIEQPQRLNDELDDIMGVHDVSRGTAPVNSPDSGLGISILVEQDTTPIGRLVKETAIAWGKVASMVLQCYAANATETRKAVISASVAGQAPETVSWTGADLMNQVKATVPQESMAPRSKAQQMQLAQTMMTMGLITSIEQFIKVSEMPDEVGVLEAVSPDVAKARRENHKMALGEPVIPAAFDEHVKHNVEHLNFMKSPRWDTLTPEAQQIFLVHLEGHATMSAEQLGDLQVKAGVSPLLATAARTDSAPVLPPEALASVGAPPAGPEGGIAAAVQDVAPGVSPEALDTL